VRKWESGQTVYIMCGRVDLDGVADDTSEPAIDPGSVSYLPLSVVRPAVEDGEAGAWVRGMDGAETWYADRFLMQQQEAAGTRTVIDALRADCDALRAQLERRHAPAEVWFMETFDADWVDSPTYAREILRQYVATHAVGLPVPGDEFAMPGTMLDGPWREKILSVQVMLVYGRGSTISLDTVLAAGGRIVKKEGSNDE